MRSYLYNSDLDFRLLSCMESEKRSISNLLQLLSSEPSTCKRWISIPSIAMDSWKGCIIVGGGDISAPKLLLNACIN